MALDELSPVDVGRSRRWRSGICCSARRSRWGSRPSGASGRLPETWPQWTSSRTCGGCRRGRLRSSVWLDRHGVSGRHRDHRCRGIDHLGRRVGAVRTLGTAFRPSGTAAQRGAPGAQAPLRHLGERLRLGRRHRRLLEVPPSTAPPATVRRPDPPLRRLPARSPQGHRRPPQHCRSPTNARPDHDQPRRSDEPHRARPGAASHPR